MGKQYYIKLLYVHHNTNNHQFIYFESGDLPRCDRIKERITTIITTIKRSCSNSAQIYQIQNSRMIRKLIVFFLLMYSIKKQRCINIFFTFEMGEFIFCCNMKELFSLIPNL